MHPSEKYVNDVLSDKITACRWVKLACERHLKDLEHGHERGLWFDYDAADHALEFFSHLKLWKGREYKGKPFVLAPHYQFIVSSIMGWKRENGLRRFRTAYNEMGRKGAKTTVAAGLGAYFFIADGEHGAEIYSAAVKKDQAKLVWTNIQNLTKGTIFEKAITYYTSNLSIKATMSKCEPLSSDYKSLDGLDTHFASLDELHAHTTPYVHDLIIDSLGARSQPLVLIITTAGFDQSGVCYDKRDYLTQVLKGTVEDDSFFGVIYTLDTKKDWPKLKDEDDWTNEDVWVKAMPGLCGVTKSGKRFGINGTGKPIPGYMTKIDDVREKADYAKSVIANQNNFLTKRMNIWTQQYDRWIDLERWDACNLSPINEQQLENKICYGGIDLSAISDLTVWTMLFPDSNGILNVLMRVWCPESRIIDKSNKYMAQYQGWKESGFLLVTEGNAIDYDFVRDQIVNDARRFRIDSIAVDRAFQGYEFSQKLNIDLGGTEKAPKVLACGMGFLSMAGPCLEFEKRLLDRRLNHAGNPVLRWMADNVSVSFDPAGNKKPNKATSQGKIDGIIGILLALDRYLRNPIQTDIPMPIFV